MVTHRCVKENLCLYDGSKGVESDTHWHRLFTTDQFVERGMVAANYYDMPGTPHAQHRTDRTLPHAPAPGPPSDGLSGSGCPAAQRT